MTAKNNVTRLLDTKQITYTAFDMPGEKLSALEVCDHLQIPPENVFKTIVMRAEKMKKTILAVVPATGNASPKKVAAFLNEKKVNVTTQREAEALTGLQAGGISPLALIHKGFMVVVDASALKKKQMLVSGGERKVQIQLNADDLIQLTHARTADIAE